MKINKLLESKKNEPKGNFSVRFNTRNGAVLKSMTKNFDSYKDALRYAKSEDEDLAWAIEQDGQCITTGGYGSKRVKHIKEDASYEWKPDTSFNHIKDIYNKVKANGYKYVNNEREEFMAAVKKADAKGYKPEQCRQIKDWHRDIWQHNRKVDEAIELTDIKTSRIPRNATKLKGVSRHNGEPKTFVKTKSGWAYDHNGVYVHPDTIRYGYTDVEVLDTDPNYKPNRTKSEYVVQGNYGYGWEDLTASDSQAEARNDLKAYRENETGVPHRLVTRRIPVTENLKEAFKPSGSGIQSVKCYNRYNYTLQELRVDNDNKTFERGQFTASRPDKKTKNRQEFEDIVDSLKELGYTEIKSGYRSMRNKSRNGIPTNEKVNDVQSDLSHWYGSKYPDDEIGIEQLQGITADDVLKNRNALGHCDTQVRDRVYAKLKLGGGSLKESASNNESTVENFLTKYGFNEERYAHTTNTNGNTVVVSFTDGIEAKDFNILKKNMKNADVTLGKKHKDSTDDNELWATIEFEFANEKSLKETYEWKHISKDGREGRIRQYDDNGKLKRLTRDQAKEIAKFRGHDEDELTPANESLQEEWNKEWDNIGIEIEKAARAQHIGADFISTDRSVMGAFKATFEINRGDWKHDHWAFDEVVKEYLANHEKYALWKIETNQIGSSLDDCYSAEHIAFIVPKDKMELLNSMRGLFAESVNTSAEESLTYEELQTLAMKHYNQGGDSVVECWDEQTFNDYVKEFGPITKSSAMRIFKMYSGFYTNESFEVNDMEEGYKVDDLRAYYNTSTGIDKEKFPNFFAWYDYMKKSGKVTNEDVAVSSGYEFDDDVDDLTYYYDDEVFKRNLEESPYTEIATKQVMDSDGFMTDYTMYMNINTGEYVFVFGDKDIYSPDDGRFDWECETKEEAEEWFASYNGFDDGFDIMDESYGLSDEEKKLLIMGQDMGSWYDEILDNEEILNRYYDAENKARRIADASNLKLSDFIDSLSEDVSTQNKDETKSPILAKRPDGSYLVPASSGDGYTAFNKSDVCMGHISSNNDAEAKSKFNANKFDESMNENLSGSGWWSVEFDITLDGEESWFDNLSDASQEHIADSILDGYLQGEIAEWDDDAESEIYGWWVAKFDISVEDNDRVRFDDLSETSQEHIANAIKDGYTQGEVFE